MEFVWFWLSMSIPVPLHIIKQLSNLIRLYTEDKLQPSHLLLSSDEVENKRHGFFALPVGSCALLPHTHTTCIMHAHLAAWDVYHIHCYSSFFFVTNPARFIQTPR